MARQAKPLSVKEKPKVTDYVLYDGDGLELLIKSSRSNISVSIKVVVTLYSFKRPVFPTQDSESPLLYAASSG